MITGKRIGLTVALWLVALPASAQFTADELASDAELCKFLETAEIVEAKQLSESEGVTEPYRLTLEDGDEQQACLWKNPSGRVKGFIEGWKYEIAAYRLDRHLGVNMVPPTVERRYEGDRGSCQLWVKVMMSMRDKAAKNADPPGDQVGDWNNAIYLQRAFDNLIANDDRHLGNILVTEDWRMVLIDHSRSFRFSKKHTKKLLFDEKHPDGPKLMRRLPREFVERLRGLDAAKIREIVGDYLTDTEVEAIVARKGLMLAEIDKLIAQNGEAATLY